MAILTQEHEHEHKHVKGKGTDNSIVYPDMEREQRRGSRREKKNKK
jgi:hypothetical protein